MGTIIFPWTVGIEQFIIFGTKHFPAPGILKYPVLKCFPDCFLLLAGKGSFLFIQEPLLLSILLYGVIYTAVTQVQ